jgi:hypothetical protein
MQHVRIPLLRPVEIKDLRPTQITVGMREVEAKRQRWREKSSKKADVFLVRHMIPVVKGPKQRLYLIDHHHLTRALYEENVKSVHVIVIANLSNLDQEAFWVYLDNRAWLHPFDDQGRRCNYSDIPKAISHLVDDPFRSLAGELRRIGGFAKDTTAFSEFLWADALRRRMKRKFVEQDFEHALEKAMQLAKSKEADYLPGWCGPSSDD